MADPTDQMDALTFLKSLADTVYATPTEPPAGATDDGPITQGFAPLARTQAQTTGDSQVTAISIDT